MSKSFFRKVAYGLNIDTETPSSPLDWAIGQIQNVAPIVWGSEIQQVRVYLRKMLTLSTRTEKY